MERNMRGNRADRRGGTDRREKNAKVRYDRRSGKDRRVREPGQQQTSCTEADKIDLILGHVAGATEGDKQVAANLSVRTWGDVAALVTVIVTFLFGFFFVFRLESGLSEERNYRLALEKETEFSQKACCR
jgi:hypothetical protein